MKNLLEVVTSPEISPQKKSQKHLIYLVCSVKAGIQEDKGVKVEPASQAGLD